MDRWTHTRTETNRIINQLSLREETISSLITPPEHVYNSMIGILEGLDCLNEIPDSIRTSYSSFLQTLWIEKLTFLTAVATISQIASGKDFLDKLLATLAMAAIRQELEDKNENLF